MYGCEQKSNIHWIDSYLYSIYSKIKRETDRENIYSIAQNQRTYSQFQWMCDGFPLTILTLCVSSQSTERSVFRYPTVFSRRSFILCLNLRVRFLRYLLSDWTQRLTNRTIEKIRDNWRRSWIKRQFSLQTKPLMAENWMNESFLIQFNLISYVLSV